MKDLHEMGLKGRLPLFTDNFLQGRKSPLGQEGVILPIVTLGTIRPEDSGAAQNATEFHH